MGKADSIIVADIGGTNARFAIASRSQPTTGVSLDQLKTYRNDGFGDMLSLVQRYLSEIGGDAPKALCAGVAGPNDGRSGFMVNRGWKVDADLLESACSLRKVLFVNDFEALSAGVPGLAAKDCLVLNEGLVGNGALSVVGPGTGLGVGLLVPAADRYQTLATEGGHMRYIPATLLERELLAWLSPDGAYVAAEEVLGGPALSTIYSFMLERNGREPQALTPAEIGAAALDGSDPIAVNTVALFLGSLGSVVGDIALAHGATGGVYLGGGVLPRLQGLLAGSDFMARFIDKGPLRDYASRIPVKLITAEFVALPGAAELFWRRGSP